VIRTNTERPKRIAEKIAGCLSEYTQHMKEKDDAVRNAENNAKSGLSEKPGTVGILGLSFKPGSDDVRDTPAMKIIGQLKKLGCENIIGYDPIAAEEFRRRYPDAGICYADSIQEIYDKADVLALVTAWEELRDVPKLGDKKIIDCRYML